MGIATATAAGSPLMGAAITTADTMIAGTQVAAQSTLICSMLAGPRFRKNGTAIASARRLTNTVPMAMESSLRVYMAKVYRARDRGATAREE